MWMDTVGDTGYWWAVRVPLLSCGALLYYPRRLPPLPLLLCAQSLTPLSSFCSSQVWRWLPLHLNFWSTGLSPLRCHLTNTLAEQPFSCFVCLCSQPLSSITVSAAVDEGTDVLILSRLVGGRLTRSGTRWCVWQRLKPSCSVCVLL